MKIIIKKYQIIRIDSEVSWRESSNSLSKCLRAVDNPNNLSKNPGISFFDNEIKK